MTAFSSISFVQFRNYSLRSFLFEKRIVGICGENGSGKTNLLDGIYYLCFTKSYFSRPDAKSVKKGFDGFRIEGFLDQDVEITCVLRENGRKEFNYNGSIYKKFSAHIGKHPCVMIAPDDVRIITEGSEERRKFIDTIMAQTNPSYLQSLIFYNKLLQQRNSVLKNNSQTKIDETLVDVLDKQLAQEGMFLYNERAVFLKEFIPIVLKQYANIADKDDGLTLSYQSSLLSGEQLYEQLLKNRTKDILLQRTTVGIHKDDILLLMGEESFKNIASQGQKKSLLFALKIAEFIYLKEHLQQSPFLLLDDIFEKLDEKRMNNLLQFICHESNTQVFITDTHKERLQEAFLNLKTDFQIIELYNN